MRTFALLILALLLPQIGSADSMPGLPETAQPLVSAPCSDNETKAKGVCHVWVEPDGGIWMVFDQGDEPVFMRYVPPGEPYITVWQRTY